MDEHDAPASTNYAERKDLHADRVLVAFFPPEVESALPSRSGECSPPADVAAAKKTVHQVLHTTVLKEQEQEQAQSH